jgi:signal transduction histidine kinase
MLYVPLRHGDKALGIMSIQSYQAGAYTRADLGTLQELADHCSAALERITNEQFLREHEAHKRAFLHAIPDCILELGMDGTIRDKHIPPTASASCLSQVSIPCHLADVFPADHAMRVQEAARAAVESGNVQVRQTHLRIGQATQVWEIRLAASGPDEVLAILRDVTEQRRLERQILEIAAHEQRRISHDLHDGLGQHLGGLAFKARVLQEALTEQGSPLASDAAELVKLLGQGMSEARRLAYGLDPVDLESSGLIRAVSHLARETQRVFKVKCALVAPTVDPPLDSSTRVQLFRIAQEGIRNAIQHGHATHLHLEFRLAHHRLDFILRDDGKGFDPARKADRGMGLRIMTYRARRLGGELEIESAPGSGTVIRCHVPLWLRAETGRGQTAAQVGREANP